MILDSCPGRATYNRSIAAVSVGIPTILPLRWHSLLILHLLATAVWLNHHIIGSENVVSRMREESNDPALFEIRAKRVYL